MQDFIDISIPGDDWGDFPSRNLHQNFNYDNISIYHYLVESIKKVCYHDDYEDEEYGDKDENIGEVTSKPLKKDTWLLKSGFVHDPQQNVDENNHYYILGGHVHHSMKNLLPLNTEVCVSIMNGFIKSPRCDCKARLVGQCSHATAAVLMLSNYILENGHVVEKNINFIALFLE